MSEEQNRKDKSETPTPTSSVSNAPIRRLRAPANFGSTSSVSKIARPCCSSEQAPEASKATRAMSRESDDNTSSINSAITDHGAVLTTDTEQFIIGQRVWVGGIRPGQIAFIGETQFAPGEWAGVVLDEPKGKNDGCVAGKRYFQCEPRRGIFSRLTRLTLAPLTAGAQTPISPERSRTVSPSPSVRSSILRSPTGAGKPGFMVGDRIIVSSSFGSRPGILRYLGDTKFATGIWCGVELDEPSGKNDGAVDGIRYFDCKPKYGVFVPIAKVSLSPTAKNSRMSRCGSRESLTSVGTINSVATTNTSRLRMSAQRKSNASISRPVTPKPQFSMQDILRERQRHIERLMIERDLDREDAQNQALQQQKNINEVIIFTDTYYAPLLPLSPSALALRRRCLSPKFQRWLLPPKTTTRTTTTTTTTKQTQRTLITSSGNLAIKSTISSTSTSRAAPSLPEASKPSSLSPTTTEQSKIKSKLKRDTDAMGAPKKVWFSDKKNSFPVMA